VAKPSKQLASGIARVSGAIRAKNEATLSPKFTSQIVKINAGVGDRVKRGQTLVQLDATNASIALQNAKAAERLAALNVASAKVEVDRNTALLKAGAIPANVMDKVQTGYDVSAAQLEQARVAIRASQQQIADSTITAPFDGLVTAKFKNVGDTVAMMPPSPILTLTDPDNLEVKLSVPEALVAYAKTGDEIHGVASPSGLPFTATLRVIGSTVDLATRTVEVLADIVGPLDGSLRSGALVSVDFGKSAAMAGPFIPAVAVQTEGAVHFVHVVRDSKIERRDVVVIPVNPGTLRVKSGLGPEDDVVIDGGSDLHVGDVVAIVTE
jgi:RND family efflux transporter MFP subunit